MTPEEVVRLTQIILAASPAQNVMDQTPAVWTPLLRDVKFADAAQAVQAILTRQPFVAASEIVSEVKRIRAARLEAVTMPEPNVDPDDVVGYREEARALTEAVADGRADQEAMTRYALGGVTLTGRPPHRPLAEAKPRPVGELLSGAFRGDR